MNKKAKNILLYTLGLGLGLSLLYLALRNVDADQLLDMTRQVDPTYVVLALIVSLLAHYLRAWRWSMLLRAAGYPVTTDRTFAALMVGYMVNYAIPRGGEIVRCSVLVRSDNTPVPTSAGTVVTERVIDVLMLGGLLATVFLFEFDTLIQYFTQASNPLEKLSWPLVATALALLAFSGWLVYRFRGRLMRNRGFALVVGLLTKLWQGILSIRHVRSPLLFVLSSLGIWAMYILGTWLFIRALPIEPQVDLWLAVILTTMGGVGMTIPVPGGLGPFHQAITLTFVLYGYANSTGAIVALMLHTPQLVVNVLVGALGYAYLLFRKPITHQG